MKGGEEEGEGPPISLSMKRQGILTARNYSHLTECTDCVHYRADMCVHRNYFGRAVFSHGHGGRYTVGGSEWGKYKIFRTLSYFCPIFRL